MYLLVMMSQKVNYSPHWLNVSTVSGQKENQMLSLRLCVFFLDNRSYEVVYEKAKRPTKTNSVGGKIVFNEAEPVI